MKRHQLAVLAAVGLLTVSVPGHAQDTGGFKGILKRTAGAVMGQPSDSTRPVTVNGTTGTDGPTYRPISPTAGGTFEGVFHAYSPTGNPGKFPRVSLYFETFGASEPCWRTRATIWLSERSHREETFDLCNAPIVTKDDLGATTVLADPTTTYLGMLSRQPFAPGVPITPDRTIGPNPPRVPFLMDFGSAPNKGALRGQYQAIVTRALVISGYAKSPYEPLMWVAGFSPEGNKDDHAR